MISLQYPFRWLFCNLVRARALVFGAAGCAGVIYLVAALSGCDNSPYPAGATGQNALYSSFLPRSLRYLDPTSSYTHPEATIVYQVYEPLYAYHYLKRPFVLQGRAAESVAHPRYLGAQGQVLPDDAPANQIAETVYEVHIKPGIMFAPHPAFAKDAKGQPLYLNLTSEALADKHSPWDFPQLGTRELVADDFVYAFKRHATTRTTAPVFGIFSDYLIGLAEYGKLIKAEDRKLLAGLPSAAADKPFLDFRKWPLAGAQAIDKYTLRLRIKGKYPQWSYWMAMGFAAPIPWEADAFYSQPGMAAHGLSLNTWPVGTGPFMLTEHIRDRKVVLKRNPNYRGEPYPCEGTPQDKAEGLLADCGKMTPLVDAIVMTAEKEALPMDVKFRQGYYDFPDLDHWQFGMAYKLSMEDSPKVRKDFTDKGVQLTKAVDMTMYYVAFNWLDPVVGRGDTPAQQVRNRKLRQALSIVIDWDEYSRVFPKKGGETAMAPLPAGLFGSRHGTREGLNPVTHVWRDGHAVRRSVDEAKRLLADAGYPDGRDVQTGKSLVLYYDYQLAPTPEVRAELDWMIKQFAKINVQLEIRATDFNQFQDKLRKGRQQIFLSGWNADYPDAENFLTLLYGPNAKVSSDGDNTANYSNPEFDKLLAQLKFMDDGPAKQVAIDKMVKIVQEDAIWSWGYFPYSSGAFHKWVHNTKPTSMVLNLWQYVRIDAAERERSLHAWNRPIYWPLVLLVLGVLLLAMGAIRVFKAREQRTALPVVDGSAA